ncbi:MAG: hypothetical protein JW738_02140, partial [Actinobacteria bacterium]|nr:hypothetical protein [Actinomycetota bacterium]
YGEHPIDGGVCQIWYADNTSGSWVTTQLTTATDSNNQYYPKIAIDSNGYSHITWYGYRPASGGARQIWYTNNKSGSWETTQITNSTIGNDQASPRIDIDSSGISHIVWWGPHPKNGGCDQVWCSESARPTITGLSPNTGIDDQHKLSVATQGSNFKEGAKLTLTGPETIGPLTTTGSGNTLKVDLDLVGKKSGSYKATVENPDHLTGSLENAFTITKAPEPPGPPPPSELCIWYLAEGSTNWGFSTYIAIENPNEDEVQADIEYMTANGSVSGGTLTLPPVSQMTVNPEEKLGKVDFSAKVTSRRDKPIAVDRTMMWSKPGASGTEAHCSIGVNSASRTWYLPEGSSKWGFETWLLIQNPNDSEATCSVTYMIEGKDPKTLEKKIGADSRASFDMADDISAGDASIKVTSDIPVICERSMYRHNRMVGHDSIGATEPASDFYLAEGAVGYADEFTTYILVQNPQDEANKVTLSFLTGSGEVDGPVIEMPPNSRKTVNVGDYVKQCSDVSTRVHGEKPVAAERSMYWGHEGWSQACHDSIGISEPHSVFYLPDGQSSDVCETWTLVANPNDMDVKVRISYLASTEDDNLVFNEIIPANSRKSFNMADKGISGRASVMVESLTPAKKIISERAMYWNNRGAGTDTIGGFAD